MTTDFDLAAYREGARRRIETDLDRRMPSEDERPETLHRAMRHAVFSGGKRLRPILCLAAAEAASGAAAETAMAAAAAVEFLHTYTLVHDDLPAMDDDDERRGKPTCHVAYGEANAILAGDALQALAFEQLADTTPQGPWRASDLVKELALAAGSRGVVGGQVEDMAFDPDQADLEQIAFIHQHKTADLFRAAIRMGVMSGPADEDTLECLTRYAGHFGMAFQITDDLLDADDEKNPMSCLSLYSPPQARALSESYVAEAVTSLKGLDPVRCMPLQGLARMLVNRTL